MHQYWNIKSTPNQLMFVSNEAGISDADKHFKEVLGKDPAKMSHIVNRKHTTNHEFGVKRIPYSTPLNSFYYKDLLTANDSSIAKLIQIRLIKESQKSKQS